MKGQRLVCRLVALLGIGACASAAPVLAQECPELVGRWPYGPSQAVAVSDGYAYFGSGTALMVADISDPAAPQVVGEIALASTPKGVESAGGYAYVADREAGLRVVDISDPTAPVEVGFVDTPGLANGVAVSGSYAYVADRDSGLRVVDVSTPSEPAEVGFVDTPGRAFHVAIGSGYAFVADADSGLRVIDVSTASAPVEVGSVDTPGSAYGVAVEGVYAYVADWESGLRVIDIAIPSAPLEVGFVDTPDSAYGVEVSGSYAYVAGWTGLSVIDISTPSTPVAVGFVDTPGFAQRVAVEGGYAFVADYSSGLRVVAVTSPSAPVEVGFVDTPGSAEAIAAAGGYAYVGFFPAGFGVLDISSPSAPTEVGFVDTPPGHIWDVAVSDGYAYLANHDDGLRVIDVSNPSAPMEVGILAMPGQAQGVAVSRGYAYVAAAEGLSVVDVSTPSAPVEVGFVDTPGYAFGVAVSGAYVYVAAGDAGLRVIDANTPSMPVEVGFVDTPGPACGVAVSGGHAYVADQGRGLRVIDVSTPSAPVAVGFWDAPDDTFPHEVAVAHGFAYVLGRGVDDYLAVVDVSSPSAPVAVGSLSMPWMERVAVSARRVFLANADWGMTVFAECGGGSSPDARECFIPAAAVAAGAQGAFFQTDVEINNTGAEEAEVHFQWLPRGEDNSEPLESAAIGLAPGASQRYEDVLTELFGLEPDSLGALKLVASTESVIGMSRTYNVPGSKAAGTFGQGLPAIRATDMIQGTEPQRIIFLSENNDSRANVGCVNGSSEPVTINIGLFDDEGSLLETKTMDLAPYSDNQINRVFEDYAPVNGYVDVWTDGDEALYYCYGSMLDNLTNDPTTILPQVTSADTTFIPAAALAAGLEGSFFQTDVDLNNVGSTELTYELVWLPRGANNSDPLRSDTFTLAPGAGVRYANVLDAVFGLAADQVGGLAVEASGEELLAMSRTYNLPSAKVGGTFGQELPGIPADRMIRSGVKKRTLFMSENDDVRANVGCINGAGIEVAVAIELYGSDGVKLETKYMMLPPYSNRQINGIFQDYAPVSGYVDVRTYTPDALIYCYGSVLDNQTSDPTTVLPQ